VARREERPIDRTTAEDLLQLAYNCGPVPAQVGAVLTFGDSVPFDLAKVREVVAARIASIPRLRRRLHRLPIGCGRPIWVDDPAFDIDQHVTSIACPSPGDQQTLLDMAARLITTPLPANRPLWSATLVTGLAQRQSALILVFHHVLADGIGGLAVLGRLMDGETPRPSGPFPMSAPSRRELFTASLTSRARALTNARTALRRLVAGAVELRLLHARRAVRCSLNRPTGRDRRLMIVRADLAAVSDLAHAHGGTVNDVALTAITGALRALLLSRDEKVDTLTVSVLVSARTSPSDQQLGNRVGVIPVTLPTTGAPVARLEATARVMRSRKAAVRGASAALLGPAFRALAALHLVGWFVNRQRTVNTFVTNLRGPTDEMSFLGRPIVDIAAVSETMGNVSVGFALLSYAGTLSVTVVADPDVCPDMPLLATALQHQFDVMTGVAHAHRYPESGGHSNGRTPTDCEGLQSCQANTTCWSGSTAPWRRRTPWPGQLPRLGAERPD
jgi:diacylglycerol O-acyltransferase / wax synthase